MFTKMNSTAAVVSMGDATVVENSAEGLSRKEKFQVAAISSGAALAINVGVRLAGKGISAIAAKRAAKKAEKPAS